MIIKTLHIVRLFGEYTYSLDLCDGLTFLHSPNGYGKSTLMRLLNASLKGDLEYISGVPFERLDIGFDDGSALQVVNSSGDVDVYRISEGGSERVTAEQMASIRNVTYLPPERVGILLGNGQVLPALPTYADELCKDYRKAQGDSDLLPFDGIADDLDDDELEFAAKGIKSKLDFMKEAGFEPTIPDGMEFPPSRYDLTSRRSEYIGLMASLNGYIERNYCLAESIVVYMDIVNHIFINKTVSVNAEGMLTVTMRNGSELPFPALSSGERQILIMFFVLLFHAKQGSLVILDEPEISLHVSWQQKLGGYFTDICRVRELQMIVATHSPQVIHDNWDLARELRSDDA